MKPNVNMKQGGRKEWEDIGMIGHWTDWHEKDKTKMNERANDDARLGVEINSISLYQSIR